MAPYLSNYLMKAPAERKLEATALINSEKMGVAKKLRELYGQYDAKGTAEKEL